MNQTISHNNNDKENPHERRTNPIRPPSRRTRRSIRNIVIAVIATIPIAACSSNDSDEQTTVSAVGPTTVAPRTVSTVNNGGDDDADVQVASGEPQAEIGLAQRFVEARDARDGETVRALVTDDAVIDDFDVSNADDYLLGAELERATGWRYLQPVCTATVLEPPVEVTCTYTMENAWSQAIRVGPFTGSSFEFVIADGQIQQIRHDFDFSQFSTQVFDVFYEWLTDAYPDDVDIMFDSNSGNFRLTLEAVALFEQHTTEFVSSVNNSGSG